MIMIFYLNSTSHLAYKLWDIDTVTAGDFTVEYNVTWDAWNEFLKLPASKVERSKVFSFYKYLKKEFEHIV